MASQKIRSFLKRVPWHSTFDVNDVLGERTYEVCEMPNTRTARQLFASAGGDLLIHKSTTALWRLSDDNKKIYPVFEGDVIPFDQLEEGLEED